MWNTGWKVSKHGVFCGTYFAAIGLNMERIWGIFLYSVCMPENTDQKKLCVWTLFTQWKCKEWWNIQLTLGIWCGPLSQHPLLPATHQPQPLTPSFQVHVCVEGWEKHLFWIQSVMFFKEKKDNPMYTMKKLK